ncbi:MAG: hypothetical protein SangKO_019120 [Sandaracinaceae bacterium]
MASARIHHERALLVRQGGRTCVAWFVRWSAGKEEHGQLHLLKPVRALVPPSELGVGVEHSERGLASHEVVGWLEREAREPAQWSWQGGHAALFQSDKTTDEHAQMACGSMRSC